MDEKMWHVIAISGVGEVAVWAAESAFDEIDIHPPLASVVVENPTHLLITPQGVGMRPLAKKAFVRFAGIGMIYPASEEMVTTLSRAWEDGDPVNGKARTIQLPTQNDRNRFHL